MALTVAIGIVGVNVLEGVAVFEAVRSFVGVLEGKSDLVCSSIILGVSEIVIVSTGLHAENKIKIDIDRISFLINLSSQEDTYPNCSPAPTMSKICPR